MMKFKKVCRCLTAWTISLSMVFSGGWAVSAGELTDGGSVIAEELTDAEAQPEDAVPAEADAGEAEGLEMSAETEEAEIFDADSPEEEPAGTPDGSAEETAEPEDWAEEDTEIFDVTEETSGEITEEPGDDVQAVPEDAGIPELDIFGDGSSLPMEELFTDGAQDAAQSEEIRLVWEDDPSAGEALAFIDHEITLKLGGNLPEVYTAEWTLEHHNLDTPEAEKEPYAEIVSSTNDSVTLRAVKLLGYTVVTAAVKDTSGQEIAAPSMSVFTLEPSVEYSYDYNPDDCVRLIGEDCGIGGSVGYIVQDPDHIYGEELPLEFTDVRIKSQNTYDSNGEEIPAESDIIELNRNDDGWWWFHALQYGRVVVTVTHHATEDPDSSLIEKDLEYYVLGDRFELEFSFPNPANQTLLPGEDVTFSTILHHWWNNNGSDAGYEKISDYRLEAELAGDAQNLFETAVQDDGKSMNIKAKEGKQGSAQVHVKAVIQGGKLDGTEVGASFWMHVRPNFIYMTVTPEEMAAVRNLGPGETAVVNPRLSCTDMESGEQPVVEEYRFWWEWDPETMEITDASGKKLTADEDGCVGQAPFTIRKLTADGTQMCLRADVKNEDGGFDTICQVWLPSDGRDYAVDFRLEDNRWTGDSETWIFTNEDMVMPLDTKNLEGVDFETEWMVGAADDPESPFRSVVSEEDGYYTADNTSITLHGAKLAEVFKPDGPDNPEDTKWFMVKAIIKVNGIVVAQPWEWVMTREPYYDYRWPDEGPGQRNRFPGGDYHIDRFRTGYVEDGDHPFGEEVQVEVTNVEWIRYWSYDEEGNEVELSEPPAELTEDESGWNLHAGEEPGWSWLNITCRSLRPGEETTSYYDEHADGDEHYYCDFNVVDQDYFLYWDYLSGTDLMLPNETRTIESRLYHGWLDENGDYQEEEVDDYELRLKWDDGSPTYNTDWVDAKVVDGTKVEVSARGEDFAWYDAILVRAWRPDGEGGYYQVDDENLWINVAREYDLLLPGGLSTPEGEYYNIDKGQELDLASFGLKIQHYSMNPDDNDVERTKDPENFRVCLGAWDENVWTVKPGTEDDLLPVLIRNGAASAEGTSVYVSGQARRLDDEGRPQLDEEGNEIWDEITAAEYYFDHVCEEHRFYTIEKPATVTEAKLTIQRCEVCGVEIRTHSGKKALGEVKMNSVKSASYNTIKVTWKAAENAEGYRVLRKGPSDKSFKELAEVKASVTSYTDNTVEFNKKYTYTVYAFQKDGTTELKSKYNTTGLTVTSALSQVKLNKASSSAYNRITVTWTKVSGASGYRISRKTKGGSWKVLGKVKSTETSYVDKTPVVGTTYYYTVRAYRTVNKTNVLGPCDMNGVSAKTSLDQVKLKKASSSAYNKITVTWEKVSGASGYRISRKTKGGSWTVLGKVKSTETSYTDTKPSVETTYYYTVRAYRTVNKTNVLGPCDMNGVSAVSHLDKVKLKSAASADYNKITVTWNKVTGADGYRILRKTSGGSWTTLKDVTSTSYTDKTVVTGTKYFYTVRGYRKINNTKVLSGSYDKTGVSAAASLGKVATVTLTASSNHSNTLKWSGVAGATGYKIFCREGTSGKFVKLTNVTNGKSYVHKGLKKGTTYYYKVQAFRKVSSSPAKYAYGTTSAAKSVKAK